MWVLVAAIVASSMAFIDSTVVNVALPALQTSFGASVVSVQWVVESYGLTLAALILMGGSMGDLFGRRRMFVLGIAVFAIASMVCGLASSIKELIVARAVQGIGAAFLVPGSLALISASFDERERGRAIGTWSGSTAITTAIGPVLGGWLIEHFSWRWAFFLNLPLAVAVIAMSLWRVPESRSGQHKQVDWMGVVIATLSLSGLVFGFIESSSLGWTHPAVFISLVLGAIGSIAFLFVEAAAVAPMVPLDIFRSEIFSGGNLLTLFLYAAIGTFFFLFPLDLIQVQGYSPATAGAAVLPFILLMFLLSRWSGSLVDRYGARLPLTIGPLIVAFGFLLLSIPSVGNSYWVAFFPAMVLLGLGMAVVVAPLTTIVMDAVKPDRLGTASGVNNAVARVAGLLGIAVLGGVMVSEFAGQLQWRLAASAIPAPERSELQSNATRMAALKPPAGTDSRIAAAIGSAVTASFVSGFRIIMWICAALALVSAAITLRMIPARSSRRMAHSLSAGQSRAGVRT